MSSESVRKTSIFPSVFAFCSTFRAQVTQNDCKHDAKFSWRIPVPPLPQVLGTQLLMTSLQNKTLHFAYIGINTRTPPVLTLVHTLHPQPKRASTVYWWEMYSQKYFPFVTAQTKLREGSFSARERSLRRLCSHRCLSVHRRGGMCGTSTASPTDIEKSGISIHVCIGGKKCTVWKIFLNKRAVRTGILSCHFYRFTLDQKFNY